MDDERDTPARSIKMEDAPPMDAKPSDGKATYKSWKKKYRKMRIKFDQKMHEGEMLHEREVKAHATSKRLAIEVDRLLDFLLDINSQTQIPADKRFDLSLPITDPSLPILDIDDPSHPDKKDKAPAGKSLRKLLSEVPHFDHAATIARDSRVIADMQGSADSPVGDPARAAFPPTFLTMDDVDNYLYEIDSQIREQEMREGRPFRPHVPTMATSAKEAKERANGLPPTTPATGTTAASSAAAKDAAAANRDFALRNPTSVYNWLRKHAPKTFLQDHEGGGGGDKDTDDHDAPAGGKGSRGGRKSTGERGGKGSRASKRASAATSREKRRDVDDTMEDLDDEIGYGGATPSGGAGAGKGKRKRAVDDDTGYRPKGGSSRPTKKKRKSEGDGPATKGRKSVQSVAAPSPGAEELSQED